MRVHTCTRVPLLPFTHINQYHDHIHVNDDDERQHWQDVDFVEADNIGIHK